MPYQIEVTVDFDAAHSHPGRYEACQRLHGHAWKATATIQSDDLDEFAMVCDFKDLKEALRQVVAPFEHRYINEVAPFDRMSPTSENLAQFIFQQLAQALASWRVTLRQVKVNESPTSAAIYRPE